MKDISILINNGVNVEESLELFGDMATYDDTLDEFLNGIYEKLDALNEYKEKMDLANYAIYVHSLKSDARYFGFTELANLAYTHEMESKANNMDYIFNNYDTLVEMIKKTVKIASDYLGKSVREEKNDVLNVNKKSIIVADDSDVIVTYVKKYLKICMM